MAKLVCAATYGEKNYRRMLDYNDWSSEWSSGVPRLGHRRKKMLTGQQKRGRPEGHRLGGGHWLKRGQDGGTEEVAVTQRRNNTTGVDRTTVARRQNKSHLFRPHGAV